LIAEIGIPDTGNGVLPQILAFLEVARRGNLSRAAEALYVSQPTLTARLQGLEAELGEQLFVRTRRGMRLTEAGEAFLPYAEHTVQAISDGRDRLSELRRGTVGKLLLGAPSTVSTYALPALLARFTAEHPGVRLSVMTGTSEEILELVLHDRIQIGLMRALGHPEVEAVPVYSDALLAVVSPSHRLAGRKVRLAELAGESLVLFGRSSSYRAFTHAVFRQAGVMPDSVLELDNIEAAKKMVEHGIGISLVPHSAVTGELASGVLSVVDLVDTTLPHREIVAVRRHDAGPPSGTVATFMTLLSEVGSLIVGGDPAQPVASPRGNARPEPTLPALDT
jgi:DNA-binding transcriptional LysR family regulator